MIKLSKKWIKWIYRTIFIIGLVIMSTGLIMTLVFNVILSPATESHFFLKTSPEFPVFGKEIDFDSILFQPKPQYNYYPNSRPVVILVHGFTSSNVYFRGVAYELVRRGFVCLTITARGHSASGGSVGASWENETLSAVKYMRDNYKYYKIDPNRIGLVGHSMGSFSVTVASIMDQELGNYWINATVGVGGPFLNISRGFGPGFELLLSNPLLYPNIQLDSKKAMANIIVEGRTNTTRPYNYMNIIGSKDEAFSVDSAYELVYGMSPTSFWSKQGVTNYRNIQLRTTYGAFNGTARRLVVIPNVDHLFEGQSKVTCVEIINWFENSMKLSSEPNYPGTLNENSITEEYRSSALIYTLIGTLILVLPLTIYYGNWLKPEVGPPKNVVEMENKDKWKMFLIYGVVFIGISFAVSPLVQGTSLYNIISTDFLGSNLITYIFFLYGLLLLPAMIILIYYEHKKYNTGLNDYGVTLNWKSNLRAISVSFLLWFTIFIIMNLGWTSEFHNLFIWRIFSFLEFFLYMFIGILILEIIGRGMVQNKLFNYRKGVLIFIPAWKELLGSAIISGIIIGLGQGIILVGLAQILGLDIFSPNAGGMIPSNIGISIGYLPPLIIIIPLLFIVLQVILQLIASWIYVKSRNNVLVSALFSALFLTWVLVVLLPSTVSFAPRLVFMT
ncbi:MAG: alpha/beta hydrolase family protein [Candidatus Helarchaeota archaeon]